MSEAIVPSRGTALNWQQQPSVKGDVCSQHQGEPAHQHVAGGHFTLDTGAGLCGAAGGESAAGRAPRPGRGGQGEPAGGRAEQGRHAAQQVPPLRPRPRLGRAR